MPHPDYRVRCKNRKHFFSEGLVERRVAEHFGNVHCDLFYKSFKIRLICSQHVSELCKAREPVFHDQPVYSSAQRCSRVTGEIITIQFHHVVENDLKVLVVDGKRHLAVHFLPLSYNQTRSSENNWSTSTGFVI